MKIASSIAVLAAFASCPVALAWTTSSLSFKTSLLKPSSSSPAAATTATSRSRTTTLFNVPPPSVDDVKAFQEFANKQPAPASFFELQQDCIRSAQLAIRDGHQLLEVEFPPLPANVLELDDVSAYDVAQANLKLAIEFARGFTADSKNVAILLPDESETFIALEALTGKDDINNPVQEIEAGITVSSLRRSEEGDARSFKPEQTFLNLFGGGGNSGSVRPINGTDLYVILVASAQELPDIEDLHNLIKEDGTPIVFYNLKLDILRGDLGAPAFPPKDFQDRFLSRVKPVYYLRTRQYSRSTTKPPFLVNYQGCLFRAYPGQYQTLLDTGTGSYRRLMGNDIRPGLGDFKEQLTQALRDEGVLPQTEGSAFDFLRTGYKTTTWWEEDRENASMEWRT